MTTQDNWRKNPIRNNMVEFDTCFPMEKIEKIQDKASESHKYIKMLGKEDVELPKRVECMSEEEIREGEKEGAGHGMYRFPDTIKINPHMSSQGILLNYIHENVHHVLPDASENLVDHLTDLICYQMDLKR